HLMFNGTENYDDEWFKPLQEVGATGLNGTTNTDRTNYFQTVPTPALDRVLWMESDRMGHFLGAVTQEKLDEQRDVVKNEKRQGEDQPYGLVFERIFDGLFPAEHPYAHTTIGSMKDIDAASLDDVKAWFRRYYGPSNAILVLAGDVNAATARPMVERYFGDIPPGPPLQKWDAWTPARSKATRETLYDRVPQARIYRTWISPPDIDPVSTDLFIAASVLGDGKNSRLYKDLVYDKQIATSVSVFNYELLLSSLFGVVVDVKPGEDIAKVEAALDAQIEKFLSSGPKRNEVALVSTKTRAGIIRGLEQVGGFGGKAVSLAKGELVAGDPAYFQRELDELDRATPLTVVGAARAWLGDNWHQVSVLPYPEYATSSEGVDRSSGLPDVRGETTLDFPDVEQATLSNGLKVFLARRATVPVVDVAIQFDAGFAADAGGKLGLANFTTAMLDEGAGDYDALGFARALEGLGASFGAGSSLDTTTVSLSALTENLSASVGLMADAILRPKFAAEEIERQRKLILTRISQEKASPGAIAQRLLPSLIYGDGHAYAVPFTGSGDPAVVEAISRDDLIAFKEAWLRPSRAEIVVVGDTTMADIQPVLEKAFGRWKAMGEAPAKQINTVELPDKGSVLIIDRPGSAQSFLLAGHVAPPTGDERAIAIAAMNEVFGGSFVSRLNLNLREDKGWSYGVRTVLASARGQRPFLLLAPVQTDKTAEAIAEIKAEYGAFTGDRPASAAELERVILDNVRSLPGQYETAGDVLGSVLASRRFQRPLNYPETLPQKFRSLTPEDIKAVARDVLHPDKLRWVIVGDAEKIREAVEKQGLGQVTVQPMSSL
ncbi:MAG: pitrilysin family protein, partial [Pseudomonadota bacterium]